MFLLRFVQFYSFLSINLNRKKKIILVIKMDTKRCGQIKMTETKGNIIEKDKNESIDLRLTIKPGDELYKNFLEIKKATGIKNNSEVLRFALTQVSTIPFSEFIKKLGSKSE